MIITTSCLILKQSLFLFEKLISSFFYSNLYVLPSENKQNPDKFTYHQHHRHLSPQIFRKEPHHNPIYSSDTEDPRVQTYMPLLIQNELHNLDTCCSDRKNETNAKLNSALQSSPETSILPYICQGEEVNLSGSLFHKNADVHRSRNMVGVDQSLYNR